MMNYIEKKKILFILIKSSFNLNNLNNLQVELWKIEPKIFFHKLSTLSLKACNLLLELFVIKLINLDDFLTIYGINDKENFFNNIKNKSMYYIFLYVYIILILIIITRPLIFLY